MNLDLAKLIERLEAATGPDRELEAEIWLAVTEDATRNKWSYVHKATGRECWIDETRDKFGHWVSVPRYMESLDAAMTLVSEGAAWSVNYPANDDGSRSVFGYPSRCHAWVEGGPEARVYAKTPALALCIAALKARTLTGGSAHG